MAVEILFDPKHEVACMWDNTTDMVFGPVFSGPSADTEVQEFLDWLRENPGDVSDARIAGDGTDPGHYPADPLEEIVKHWCDLPTVTS